MFQFSIKNFVFLPKMLNNNFSINIVNYIIDKNNDNYLINNNYMILREKDQLSNTTSFIVSKLYDSDVISQLPLNYKLDSNILISIVIMNDMKLIVRAYLKISNLTNKILSSLSLKELISTVEVKEVYFLNTTDNFELEKTWLKKQN
jgi:hypothetical protein